MPFLDFEAIKASTDILQVAQDLGLTLRKSGAGYRSPCPTCKTDDQRGLVITPGKGYYCFAKMKGGDVIGLAAHILEVGNKDAAGWLMEMYSLGTSTVLTSTVQSQEPCQVPDVPQKTAARTAQVAQPAPASRKPAQSFDPAQFADNLAYGEAVADLGLSEAMAKAHRVGIHRGKLYVPLCPPDAVPAGYAEYHDGKLKLPDKWLASNVIQLKRPA